MARKPMFGGFDMAAPSGSGLAPDLYPTLPSMTPDAPEFIPMIPNLSYPDPFVTNPNPITPLTPPIPPVSVDPVRPPFEPTIEEPVYIGESVPEEPEEPVNQDRLLERRQEEFLKLKEAYYTIMGDTFDTAIAEDSIGEQQLKAFTERWDKILEDNKYSGYKYRSDYGGYTSMVSPYNSLTDVQQQNQTSGYLRGMGYDDTI